MQALNSVSPALTDAFTYTVKDAHGATSAATLTISVNGTNDTPVVLAGGTNGYIEQAAATWWIRASRSAMSTAPT